MSSFTKVVNNSVRSQGRDTIATKPTNFIDVDAITASGDDATQAQQYALWTDEHSASAKARRENRESRVKPPRVAEVEEFDVESHLKGLKEEQTKEKSKWKLW